MSFIRLCMEKLRKVDGALSSVFASDAAHVFEIELLSFPVVVVLLASAALICGSTCALWQWWGAIGIAILIGWRRSQQTRSFSFGTALFAVALLSLWVACGISIVPLGDDPLRYHLPGIRLLTEGWNPVWQGRWDIITSTFGIDPSETKELFILPNAKGVWYFDAVAYFFVRNPFNLTMPAYLVLSATSCLTVVRNFPKTNMIVRLAMILAMLTIVPGVASSIDAAVGFSGICLLTAMYKCIARDDWDWGQLLCYSFWMCCAKQTGALHCVVFWLFFSAVILYKAPKRWLTRLIVVAVLMLFSNLLVSASPYFSAWKEFGHPLYPRQTVDEKKYPVYNIVACDFLLRNEDAASMGHLGAYIRAYISSTFADWYYNHKLNRTDFSPDGLTWRFYQGYPTPTFRAVFCGCLLLLLFLGKREDYFVVITVTVASAAMPTEMLGYVRYCPWMLCGMLFSMSLLAHGKKMCAKLPILTVLASLYCLPSVIEIVRNSGWFLACAQASMQYLETMPPKSVFNGLDEVRFASQKQEYFEIFFSEKGTTKRGDDVNKTSLGNIKLLQRQVPALSKARIVDFTMGGPDAQRFRASNGTWKSFYDNSFKVAPEESLPPLRSAPATIFLSFPELLFRRLTGRFAWN